MSLRTPPRSLAEIRSAACNSILVTVTVLTVIGAGASVLRMLEQGWLPVMGAHVLLALALVVTTLGRKHLSLAIRAGAVTAVPYIVAVGGMLSYGRGTGVAMFFVSSCVLAGCFFNLRIALSVVGLCVASLAAMYFGTAGGMITLPLNPVALDVSPLSWIVFATALIVATAAPLIGLYALLTSLDAERQRTAEALRVRADFLAHMSHELRTPMAGLLGLAEALRGTRLDDQQKSYVTSLLGAGRNLFSVLNDLLDFAKFDSGRVPVENAPFSLGDTVRNTCAAFAPMAAEKGLTLDVEMPASLHDALIGDAHRIGHVLANLIDNAIKFTVKGGVSVRVAQTPRTDGRVTLICAVVDTGIGMSPEESAKIFEPFAQADTSISRRYGGTGLGLAICKKLIDAMDGTIAVTARSGAGASFIFQVPLAPHTGAARLGKPAPKTGRELRILVAEDDRHMQLLVEIMLPRMGYAVTLVRNGAAAVEAAAAAMARGETFDCIVMDMHMPVMNGVDAMRAIHANERGRGTWRTPMLALTADLIPEHVRGFMNAGADALVGKPVDWSVLDAKIQELTQTPAAAPAGAR